jgi:hypothetical protein
MADGGRPIIIMTSLKSGFVRCEFCSCLKLLECDDTTNIRQCIGNDCLLLTKIRHKEPAEEIIASLNPSLTLEKLFLSLS